MGGIVYFYFFIATLESVYGHNNKFVEPNQNIRDEADLQSELMPQELNPVFDDDSVPHINGSPIYHPSQLMGLPLRPNTYRRPRTRRSADAGALEQSYLPVTMVETVKTYSRVIASFVLVLSAAIEVIVYVIESYQGA